MQTQGSNAILETALTLISGGVDVIPVPPRRDKPITLADEGEVRGWFEQRSDSNFAVVCGSVSGNLVVFDLDTAEAAKEWSRSYESRIDGMPVVKTSRGWYVWIRPDRIISTSMRVGYEVRNDGAVVLAPPIVHSRGKTYTLLRGGLGFWGQS